MILPSDYLKNPMKFIDRAKDLIAKKKLSITAVTESPKSKDEFLVTFRMK